jgi:hypothetical protein
MFSIRRSSTWIPMAAGLALLAAGTPAAEAQGRAGGPATRTPSALRAVPAETTAAKVKDPNWTPGRTPWGHPDLEGIWTSDDMRSVPTQRPAAQGTRQTLTPEEFARRSGGDEGSRDRAVNQETILRNEWGVRTFGYTSLVVEPADGRIPEMTPAGLARRADRDQGTFGAGIFNGFEDFTLYDRCLTRGIVGSVLPVLYGNGFRLMQTPDSVVISYEMVHDTRVIPLDGRPHVGQGIRQWLGDSRGRWEGDTLVVETTNLTDRTSIGANGNGTRHSAGMRMVERFTRIDPQMIDYTIRIEDPATYTAPFALRLTVTQQPDYQLYEYSCHEGNGAVSYALAGERAYEKEVADAKAKGLPVPSRDRGSPYAPPVEGLEVVINRQ